ncbi:MAG: hypothetical protein EP335_10645 [Alphaproteobacteria bacterium]|nr:MAG: hypothetical protein EP335_10645 [Alphaproteobacteria bacterium]
MTAARPYAVPADLAPALEAVQAYWKGLLRGSAEIPFADDLQLEALGSQGPRLALLDVFEKPERFRVCGIGAELATGQSTTLAGRFVDEVNLYHPLEFLRSQASATVESGAATCYSQGAAKDGSHAGFSRLMLPLWGEGHISMILVAVDWH